MRVLIFLSLLLTSCLSAAVESNPAHQLLEQLAKSLRQLNFTTSFVVIKNNNSEPYHWAHGVNANGDELELLSLLNGAYREVVRRNDKVVYLESGMAPYSVASSYISGPIPEILSGDISQLLANYDCVSVGKSRILGRAAHSIRIVSKDPYRYGHRLWLDQESGLLLKFATIGSKGQVLEQIQFMHLEIDEEINPSLRQIEQMEFTEVVQAPNNSEIAEHQWHVSWLPAGFYEIHANNHRILHTEQPTEFKLFSDGLVNISVYVTAIGDEKRLSGFAQDGATLVYNDVYKGFEVSIVGNIPPATAKEIADSITSKK